MLHSNVIKVDLWLTILSKQHILI